MEKMFRQLKDDHKKLSAALDRLLNGSGDDRKDLFDQLKDEMTVHMRLEEKLLFPLLKESDESHDRILESCEEHRAMKQRLEQLGKALRDGEKWQEVLGELKEDIRRHVMEEERGIFRQAETMIDTAPPCGSTGCDTMTRTLH